MRHWVVSGEWEQHISLVWCAVSRLPLTVYLSTEDGR
jgi:hypothetical protein